MMDPITIAMGLATYVPDIIKWISGSDKAADAAQKVVSIAQTVTGTTNGNDALAAVRANPTLALQLQQEIDRNTEVLAQISQTLQLAEINAQVQTTAAVNATMQAEDRSDHWPTYTWRPFIGFIFGVMIFGDYFVIPVLNGWFHIPQPVVPPEAWVAIGGVLGVASFYRGKMQADPNVKSDNRG